MKGNIPLDPTIDYREVVADPRFEKCPARVRASVMKMLRIQAAERSDSQNVRMCGLRKNKQRLRNKAAKASRKRNRR